MSKRAQRWAARNTLRSSDLPDAGVLLERKGARTVGVAIPALNESQTIGAICRTLRADPLVDELVVVDGGSTDGTADAARAAGADVYDATELVPEVPGSGGKGDSLWRSLSVLNADIVVWLDGDVRDLGAHFVSRLTAPLLLEERVSFVKAYYRRPLAHGDALLPSGGGRVTELLARPLLNALFPELGGVLQPLAGEYAGRRDILQSLPFLAGYGVDVALLIDMLELTGLDSIVQVDLDERVHRNRPLEELSPMAHSISKAILRRAEQRGRIVAAFPFEPAELPPIATILDGARSRTAP